MAQMNIALESTPIPGIQGITSKQSWPEFCPIPGILFRNCLKLLGVNACGWGWEVIPRIPYRNWFGRWQLIEDDGLVSLGFRNWWELIPGAEPVPQCSTSRNWMYSHLRQLGDLKKSRRSPFKGDYTVYIDCMSVIWSGAAERFKIMWGSSLSSLHVRSVTLLIQVRLSLILPNLYEA